MQAWFKGYFSKLLGTPGLLGFQDQKIPPKDSIIVLGKILRKILLGSIGSTKDSGLFRGVFVLESWRDQPKSKPNKVNQELSH